MSTQINKPTNPNVSADRMKGGYFLPISFDIMYIMLPLLFSQFISVHHILGFPPHYCFLLIMCFRLPTVLLNDIVKLSLVSVFLLLSSLQENAYREAIQIILDMFFGYLVARYFLQHYSYSRMVNYFKKSIYIWACIIVVFMLDFYILNATLNGLLEPLTGIKAGGTSTLFVRVSIIWGNPNWLSMFYLLLFTLYVSFGGKNIITSVIAAIVLFILQTKTAYALGFLLFSYVVVLNLRHKSKFIYAAPIIAVMLIAFVVWFDGFLFWVLDLQNYSSFVNRQRILTHILPDLKWYPNGLFGDYRKAALVEASDEDTVPSLIMVAKLLGWPILILILLKEILTFNSRRSSSIVMLVLTAFAVTQSFLSISAVCGLAVFAYFLSSWHTNRKFVT